MVWFIRRWSDFYIENPIPFAVLFFKIYLVPPPLLYNPTKPSMYLNMWPILYQNVSIQLFVPSFLLSIVYSLLYSLSLAVIRGREEMAACNLSYVAFILLPSPLFLSPCFVNCDIHGLLRFSPFDTLVLLFSPFILFFFPSSVKKLHGKKSKIVTR